MTKYMLVMHCIYVLHHQKFVQASKLEESDIPKFSVVKVSNKDIFNNYTELLAKTKEQAEGVN